jgi:hypothetical protein
LSDRGRAAQRQDRKKHECPASISHYQVSHIQTR